MADHSDPVREALAEQARRHDKALSVHACPRCALHLTITQEGRQLVASCEKCGTKISTRVGSKTYYRLFPEEAL